MTSPTHGQCPYCRKPKLLRQRWAFGNIETWACDACTEEPSDFWDRKAGTEERAR